MATPLELPEGFHFRRTRLDDAAPIAALMNAVDLADTGEADSSVDDVKEVWAFPRLQMDRDTWVLEGPDHRIVGYAWCWDRKPHVEIQADSYVAPGLGERGLEEALLAQIEERAAEHREAAPRNEEVVIRIFTSAKDAPRIRAFTTRGYVHVRTFCRMTVEVKGGLQEPVWPAGIEPRPFSPERDGHAADLAIQESFADHFGYVSEPHEDWIHRRTTQSAYDPSLWTLAWDGPDVAGAILAYAPEGYGWIRELGVRPAWRGRGVGKALLLHAFGLLAERGVSKIGLGVDVANTTGATQLYESVGMKVAFSHDLYEKRLGAGLAA